MITETIPLDRVCSVRLSRSWRSGLSLSLKRVCVQLDQGARYISPRDREQFMTDLMEAVAAVKGEKKRSGRPVACEGPRDMPLNHVPFCSKLGGKY